MLGVRRREAILAVFGAFLAFFPKKRQGREDQGISLQKKNTFLRAISGKSPSD